MRRGSLAGGLLVAWVGAAGAEPTRKVVVETTPPGATVYLDDIENGEICKTPCPVDVPLNRKASIIVRKDGFSPDIKSVDLRKGRVKSVTFELTSTTATLVFEDPGLTGGTILVDDVDKGRAPTHVPVEVAGHHVVVTVRGRTVFDDFVNLDAGEEYTIKPNKAEPAPLPPKQVTDPNIVAAAGGDDDGGGSDDGTAKVAKSVEVARHDAWIAAGGVFQVGFRQFRYDNPKNLAPFENEGGQVLVGPSVELWPARLLGAHHLRGLSVFAKVEFGANHRQVLQDPSETPTGAATYWGNIEVDVQHRWDLGETGAIELGGGFVRDQLEYQATSTMALAQVPFADYKAMRLGVRGILRLGAVEPYAQIEGRIPFSEGTLATRFSHTDVTGGGAEVGLAAMLGPIALRLEGSIIYYGWTITNDNAGPTDATADGARDVLEGISVLASFAY